MFYFYSDSPERNAVAISQWHRHEAAHDLVQEIMDRNPDAPHAVVQAIVGEKANIAQGIGQSFIFVCRHEIRLQCDLN